MTKKYPIYIIIAVGLIGGALGAALYSHKNSSPVLTRDSRSGSNSAYSGDSMARSFSDPAFSVGSSDEVFVGKIIRLVGSENYPISGYPSVQFAVQVIYNIKGHLQDVVALSQFRGGLKLPQAQVGSTYIFAVKYTTEIDWYSFGGDAEAYQLLSNDANLSDAELKSLAEKDARVLALQEAYPHEEIGLYARTNHIDYNSYASRHYDASGALIDDTVVLHEQYMAAHPSAVPAASPADSASTAPADQAPAPAPADNPVASPAPSDATSAAASPTAAPAASDSPAGVPAADSSTPTPTPDQVIAPTDTPTPTPVPTDTTIPAAS